MTDLLLLAVGHALVWAAGICLASLPRWWRERRAGGPIAARADGEFAWTLGAGWLVGAFVLTLVMRGASLAGIPLGRLAVGLPLLLVIAAGVGLALSSGRQATLERWRSAILDVTRTTIGSGLPPLQRVLWLALLGWLAFRFGLLLVEATTRPLYPWDAWMQWATKARVWFELKAIVPFAPFDVWLPANGAVYFDAAPHNPATVPLWQVWSALLIGRWDDAHTNLAWWCTAVAIGLLVYGFLRSAGGSRWLAIVGAWLAGSLPIANVHVALAGYADLPLAAYVTLAMLAGWRWARLRRTEDLLLLLLCLVALPTIKNPGKAWLVLLLPGIAVAAWPRWGLRAAGLIACAGALALLILAQTNPVDPRLPDPVRGSVSLAGTARRVLPVCELAPPVVRGDRDGAHRRTLAVRDRRGAADGDAGLGSPFPAVRLFVHHRVDLGRRPVDRQPGDAAPRAADRRLDAARLPRLVGEARRRRDGEIVFRGRCRGTAGRGLKRRCSTSPPSRSAASIR